VLKGKWWEMFNEPELNALEDQLNINNQNIAQYFPEFHGGARAGARGACRLFSHADGESRPSRGLGTVGRTLQAA
jgi:hypothetical protein